MQTSAGLLYITDSEMLIERPMFSKLYDIPKGKIEEGETPLQAVIREVYEETNLRIEKETLTDLGLFNYLPSKRLHLFVLKKEDFNFKTQLKCNHNFVDKKTNKELPEIVDYKIVKITELKQYLFENLYKVVEVALRKYGLQT